MLFDLQMGYHPQVEKVMPKLDLQCFFFFFCQLIESYRIDEVAGWINWNNLRILGTPYWADVAIVCNHSSHGGQERRSPGQPG